MTQAPLTHLDIQTIDVKINWRDVLHIQVGDAELKKHIEGALDFFQQSSFPYYEKDAASGAMTKQTLSGQSVLQNIKSYLDIVGKQMDAKSLALIDRSLKAEGVEFVKGKLTIADHNRRYDGTARNGSNTMSLNPDGSLPIAIQLGRQYLKGSRYTAVDSKFYPSSVDGVLFHELAGHAAYRTSNEVVALRVEGIISSLMGAPRRHPRVYDIKFQKNANRGYHTLYDKLPKRGGNPASKPSTDPSNTP